jgi:hypothetical protein
MKPLSIAFIATAVFLLAALFLAPQTRWLVRLQMFPGLSGGEQGRAAFVQSHPNDYPVQLAGQTDDRSQTALQYARGLVARFPDSPSLRANILRYATQGEIHLNRPEEALLQVSPAAQNGARPETPPTAAQESAFDADAAAGERLDPDNAYFPFMRAAGLLAAHRDDEGLAAIKRAGKAHRWQEYSVDEVEGRWRISEGVYSGREGLSRMAIAAALLFPHYQVLRSAARLVTAKAVQKELAGQSEEGLALRVALAHVGDLMRAQSTSMIGSLVGSAITALSRSRPGGTPAVSSPPGVPAEQWVSERLQTYCDYVTRLGHPEAARTARAQEEAGASLRHLDMGSFAFGSRLQTFAFLGISLGLGWVLAANLGLLLLLGGLAQVFSKLPPLGDRLAPSLLISLGASLAILLVLGSLAAWQIHGAFSLTEIARNTLLPSEQEPSGGLSSQAPLLLGALLGAAIPLLLLIIFGIKSLVKRLPLSVGLVEGFRDTVPPLVCALALLYCGLTLWTVHQENAVNAGLEQSLHGEGQALAAQTDKPWPGVVR